MILPQHYIAYFCVHSRAILLYLWTRRKRKKGISCLLRQIPTCLNFMKFLIIWYKDAILPPSHDSLCNYVLLQSSSSTNISWLVYYTGTNSSAMLQLKSIGLFLFVSSSHCCTLSELNTVGKSVRGGTLIKVMATIIHAWCVYSFMFTAVILWSRKYQTRFKSRRCNIGLDFLISCLVGTVDIPYLFIFLLLFLFSFFRNKHIGTFKDDPFFKSYACSIQLSSSSSLRPKVRQDDTDKHTLTFPCPSCRCGRSQVLRGHPGLGHTAESRWTGGLVTDQTKFKRNSNQYAHIDKHSFCHFPLKVPTNKSLWKVSLTVKS